jgi:hypothetical protein
MTPLRSDCLAIRLSLTTLCIALAISPPVYAQSMPASEPPRGVSSAVLKAVFQTTAGAIENIGTGFFLETTDRGTVFVTALHVFGPPGGIAEWVPSSDLPTFVESAVLTNAFSEEPSGHVVRAVPTPDARLPSAEEGSEGRDLAVFEIADPARMGLEPASGSAPDLWIVSPGLPTGDAFPVRRVEGPSHFLSVAIPADLALPLGISGSPIVTADGTVAGLVAMLGEGPAGERVIHATPIESVLRALDG